MQPKIYSAPTIVYPESDRNRIAESDKHRQLTMDFIQMIEHYFRNKKDVYVSGDLLIYYEEGNPRKCVGPDVFVVFGVTEKSRRTYLTWEEGHTPDFVLEVASPSTYRHDMGRKKALYASVLGVKEYYIYDPHGEMHPSFIGYRLVDGVYQEIDFVDERLPSHVLGLELGERKGRLGLYNPDTGQWLQPPAERAEQESLARQGAEARAKNAEAKLAKALAELERLRSGTAG